MTALTPEQQELLDAAVAVIDDLCSSDNYRQIMTINHASAKRLLKVLDDIKPKPRTGKCWVNVYPTGQTVCHSKHMADDYSSPNRIARIKVIWEEGRFDD